MRSFGIVVCLALSLALGSFEAHARLKIIVDKAYEPTILKMLKDVKPGEHVRLMSFSFAIDDTRGNILPNISPTRIADRLIEIRKAGNPVTVYMESARDTAKRNGVTATYLEAQGITVIKGATHAKGLSVGERLLLFGSTNLTQQSMNNNNETNVLDDRPEVVRGFNQFFDHYAKGGERGQLELNSPLIADGKYKARIIEAINSAKTSLDFSIYYFNDAEIEAALIAAHTRGVAIRGYFNYDSEYALTLVERNQKTVARLKAAGLTQIYLDLDKSHSHSKYIIRDAAEILLGTGNWNRADVEDHPQLYILIQDAHLARSLSAYLSQQIAFETSGRTDPIHHRLWIGTRKPDVPADVFEDAISRIFVPATASAIQSRGGLAYQPVLMSQGGQTLRRARGDLILPDEIAHIGYLDLPTYRAARDMPIGQVYGPLHRDYFLMDPNDARNSRSLVAEAWTGAARIGRAYDLSSQGTPFQAEGWSFSLHLRKDDVGMTDATYLQGVTQYLNTIQRADRPVGLDGYLVAVTGEYVIEYFRFDPAIVDATRGAAAIDALKAQAGVFEAQPLQRELIRRVKPGQAGLTVAPGSAAVSVDFPTQISLKDKMMSECEAALTISPEEHARRLEVIRQELLNPR